MGLFLAKSWQPGQYKRWFLRSLQEEFDARLYPYGWDTSDFKPDENWTKAILVSQDGKESFRVPTAPPSMSGKYSVTSNCPRYGKEAFPLCENLISMPLR